MLKIKEYIYKLNRTLYYNEEADCIEDICDKINGKNEYALFARKGKLFKRIELTDSIKEEYCIPNDINLDYIFVDKNNNWITNSNGEFLDKIEKVEEV
jgi:hypothetical protein